MPQGLACDISRENYTAGILMYASYAVLFIMFALERYLWPNQRSALAPRGTDKPVASAAGGGAGTTEAAEAKKAAAAAAASEVDPAAPADPEPPVSGGSGGAPARARQRRKA
jgi:hypothetical protein